jgi:hypothetical protein
MACGGSRAGGLEASELLPDPSVLENAVRRVTRIDMVIDGHASLGDRAEPDVVIALPWRTK